MKSRTVSIIFEMVIMIFASVTLTFWLTHLSPGKVGILSNTSMKQEIRDAINAKYHYDSPLTTQFFIYIRNIFTLDFGVSSTIHPNMKIPEFIFPKLLTTVQILIISSLISVFGGIGFGILFSWKPDSIFDKFGVLFISVAMSIPAFIWGLVLATGFSQANISVLYEKNRVATWFLPAMVLAIPTTFTNAKYIRDMMVQNNSSQFVRFAVAKGASRGRILVKHLLKPSFITLVVSIPASIALQMVNGIFVESTFSIPGMGAMVGGTVGQKDFEVTQFIFMLMSVMTVVGYTLSDILLRWIDPRLK